MNMTIGKMIQTAGGILFQGAESKLKDPLRHRLMIIERCFSNATGSQDTYSFTLQRNHLMLQLWFGSHHRVCLASVSEQGIHGHSLVRWPRNNTARLRRNSVLAWQDNELCSKRCSVIGYLLKALRICGDVLTECRPKSPNSDIYICMTENCALNCVASNVFKCATL